MLRRQKLERSIGDFVPSLPANPSSSAQAPSLRLPPCKRAERKHHALQMTSARAETTKANGRSGESGRRRRKMARLDCLLPPPPRCLLSLDRSLSPPRFRVTSALAVLDPQPAATATASSRPQAKEEGERARGCALTLAEVVFFLVEFFFEIELWKKKERREVNWGKRE